ncbi:glutathione S-transferase E14-like [Ochlerotatus camptorhynchus]|uniref:glutathione S-transferase E14-like n=1 Tax=Ochlerotatus camptorhynchus TaxID=644619 RepID=UPI0031D4F052
MSKPELYYDPNSPPVRSVLLALAALGINDQVDLKLVRLFQREHLNEAFVKLNPLHKVPVWKHGDLVLTDSHAILMYLCDVYGQESEFSLNDPKKRALVNNRLCFNNSVLFQRESSLMVKIFHRQIAEVTEDHLKPLEEVVGYLETYLASSKFVACDELTVADFSIVAILSTMETICPIPASRWPKVAAWYETMKQLPYYHEANQTGLDKLKAKLNVVLSK